MEGGPAWVMAMKAVPLTANPTQELGSWILTDCGHHAAEEGVYSAVENSLDGSIKAFVVFIIYSIA